MKFNNKSGFTLLEIIIVIIIVGVLASLALPRFFSTIEFSRSTEALNSMGVIRKSISRCGLVNDSYVGCDTFADIDVEDPGTATNPQAHFNYSWSAPTATAYTLTANRTTVDGGNTGDFITLTVTSSGVTRSGSGAFASIK